MTPSKTAWWQRLALVAAGIAAAVLAGEVAARWLFAAPSGGMPAAERLAVPDGLREIESIFELATPGIEGLHKGAYYRTNRAGFRGPEVTEQPLPGILRIAVIGDSFVMGEGVLEEQAYAAVLSDVLRDGDPPRRLEVLNFGISGANIAHVLERLEGLVLSYAPDLIIYGLTVNDIELDGYRTTIDAQTIARQRALYGRFAQSRSHLLRLLWPRWVSFRIGLRPPPGTYLYEVLENYENNPQVWSNFTAALDRLAAIGRQRQIPVVVFIHPILAYTRAFHPFMTVYERIAAAVTERGMLAVDGFPAVAGRQTESLWVSPDNPHPNALAHRLFAETLAAALVRHPDLFEMRRP